MRGGVAQPSLSKFFGPICLLMPGAGLSAWVGAARLPRRLARFSVLVGLSPPGRAVKRKLLGELRLALENPASLLSFHVEAGNGAHVLLDCLRALVPDTPLWFVLCGPLVLPVAWDTALTAE